MNQDRYRSTKMLLHLALIGLGSIIGYLFSMFDWRTETEWIFGFPVPWGGFKNVNGRWLDFVGPLSVFIWAVDFFCGIGLVYLVAFGIRILKRTIFRANTKPRSIVKSANFLD
jgi:hypothetical protein